MADFRLGDLYRGVHTNSCEFCKSLDWTGHCRISKEDVTWYVANSRSPDDCPRKRRS